MAKLTRSHTTYIDEADSLLRVLEKSVLVSKISLGIIEVNCRTKRM
jgi:hypothetical protein